MSKIASFVDRHKVALSAVAIFVFISVLSFLPIFLDPYKHEEKVNFWTWLQRELDEVVHGERE